MSASPGPARRRSLRWAVLAGGVGASLVLFYFAVRGVDVDRFAEALSASEWGMLAPALLALTAAVALRTLRWRYMFAPATRPPFAATAQALLAGEFFNSIAPLRAGEIARVVALHRGAGTSRPEALAATFAERVYDVVVLVALVAVALPALPDIGWLRSTLALAGALGAAAAITGALIARRRPRLVEALLAGVGRAARLPPERADRAGAGLTRGLRALRDPRAALVTLALTVSSWLAFAVTTWLTLGAVADGLPFEAALLVVAATTFSLALPSLPAALGVFEGATVLALEPFDVDAETALGCAVVLHVVTYAPFIVAGLAALASLRNDRARTDG